MASIGSLTGLIFDRLPLLAQRDSRTVTTIGVNGYGVVSDAWRAPPQTITTQARYAVTPPLATFAATQVAAYRALIETSVTVVDGIGRSFANCLIQNCVPVPSVEVDGALLITCAWTIIFPSTAP